MTDQRAEWEKAVAGELKTRAAADLVWRSPEGIAIKPLYSEADLEGIEAAGWPCQLPYTRGPRASMYAGRPWTIRQFSGFLLVVVFFLFFRLFLLVGLLG